MAKLSSFLRRFAPLLIALGIALLFVVVHLTIESEAFEFGPLSKQGFIHLLDLKALDLKFLSRAKVEAKPKVVIAAIDEKGIKRYGLWPWNRSVIADFVNAATKGGAKVIGFDAVFSDKDRNASYKDIERFLDAYQSSGLQPDGATRKKLQDDVAKATQSLGTTRDILKGMQQRLAHTTGAARRQLAATVASLRRSVLANTQILAQAQSTLTGLDQRAGDFYQKMQHVVSAGSPDAALAKAIANSPQTVLGYFNFYNKKEIIGISGELGHNFARLAPSAISHVYDKVHEEVGGNDIEIVQPVKNVAISKMWILPVVASQAPLPEFAAAAKSFGFFNVPPDHDGAMRRIRLLNKHGGKLYPALALAVAAKYFDADIRPLNGDIRPGVTLSGINIGTDRDIATDLHGRLLINYYEDPTKFFPTYSVADFIDGTVDPSVYRGKVVLFGMTAQGLMDMRVTPFSPTTPGVYVHASAIQDILDGNYLERYYGMALAEAIGYLLLGLLMGLVLPRLPVWGGLLATAGFAVGLYFFDISVVFPRGIWMLNVLPTLQVATTLVGINVYGYLTEGKEKRKIRKAFQFYLTKSVVEEVLKDPQKLKLGGEKRVCTVLFSDIRGFTTISERLTPEQLSNLLNEYLTPMTNLVFKYDGTLDKYMGDAIMAIFGAPVGYPNHATRACFTALEMMQRLHELQVGWRDKGMPELDIGIGLNTGAMSVGNMGSEVRFDYTVMGDNVNLGSRLEGINKQYGTNIIISEFTYAQVKDNAPENHVIVREMDSVRVKGKREPVTIYELMGRGQPTDQQGAVIESFHAALARYKSQQWDEAITLFQKVQSELKPNDYASNVYIKRCATMRDNPPGADWDGVFTMTTK